MKSHIERVNMAKVSKLTDTQIKIYLNKGGRPKAKSDFLKILKKGSQPIDKK